MIAQSAPCGLNGCDKPTDPASAFDRCADCTLAAEVEVLRAGEADRQRRAAVTQRAPVDALLIAKAFIHGDEDTTAVLLKHCDPHSTTLQLAGWLRTAIATALDCGAGTEFGDNTVDDVLDRWLRQVTSEAQS
ncbi:hypothetical protein FIV07_22505 [Mycobacterium sp. THAF192]|nr:hypothetical protein FIV07_22505 [Mycobacterium sp. THAF192]